jgi:hypothetical protein
MGEFPFFGKKEFWITPTSVSPPRPAQNHDSAIRHRGGGSASDMLEALPRMKSSMRRESLVRPQLSTAPSTATKSKRLRLACRFRSLMESVRRFRDALE